MRTPGILIFGLVMAPCGWILNLTSTVAPNWRNLQGIAGISTDSVYNQGIWDMCLSYTSGSQITCNMKDKDPLYFGNQIIPIAQGMMVASLVVTLIGLGVVTPGARCWTNQPPRWTVAAIGGLLIFCSGVLTIIPIAWYTHLLKTLATSTTFTSTTPSINVGYCIVLGYIGGIMEVLGGLVISVGIFKCCGGRNRGEKPQVAQHHRSAPSRTTNPTPQPRTRSNWNPPSSSASSSAPYSVYSREDDFDYPRAKPQKRGTVNPSYSGRPYDADL